MLGSKMVEMAKYGLHLWKTSRKQGTKMSVSAPTTPLSPVTPAPPGDFHQAVLNYEPQLDGEISLRVGDVLASVRDLGNGWSLGRNVSRANAVGIFPTGCIRYASLHPTPAAETGRRCGIHQSDGSENRRASSATAATEVGDRRGWSYFGRSTRKDRQTSNPVDNEFSSSEIRYYAPGTESTINGTTPMSDEEDLGDNLNTPEGFLKECSSYPEYGVPPLPPAGSKANYVQASQKRGRWIKKPRMIVKPNLEKNLACRERELLAATMVAKSTAEDNILERLREEDSMDCSCRESLISPAGMTIPCPGATLVLPPFKSRIATPPTELSLPPQTKPSSLLFDNEATVRTPSLGFIIRASRGIPTRTPEEVCEDESCINAEVTSQTKMTAGERMDTKNIGHFKCPHTYTERKSFPGHGVTDANDEKTGRFQQVDRIYREPAYHSGSQSESKCYRLASSVTVGQAIGIVLFLWMFYHLDYCFLVSASISGTVALLLSVFLALSRVCRCLTSILLPSLCTARGRLSFVIVISGLLLSGPVSNVYVSVHEISRSMGCSAEQSYNQMMLFLKPFDSMMAQLNGTIGRLQEAAVNVSRGLRPLDDGLSSVELDIHNGRLQLFGTRKTCRNLVDSAFNECATGIHKAQDQCLGVMGALGTVYHHARVVLDRINPDRWSTKQQQQHHKRQVFAEDGSVIDEIDLTGSDRDICEPLDMVLVCQSLNDSDTLCQPSKWAGEAIQDAINATQSAMAALQGSLQFYVSSEPYDRSRNVTEVLFQIRRRVGEEFESRTAYFELVVGVLKKMVPLSLFLLIQSAYLHLKHYMSRDAYDNVYVTDQFKAIDLQRSKFSGVSVLPLRKYERNYLIETGSLALAPPERGLATSGLCVVVLHVLLSTSCYVFDYVLYWVLALVERHSRSGFDVTGSDSLELVVSGQGIIVELLDIFLKGFHPGRWFNFSGDTQACLPVPKAPSIVTLVALVCLYAVLLGTLLFKAYLLRLRNWATGYFYPDREKTRLVYLHSVVIGQRARLPQLLHQLVRANHHQDQLYSQVSVCHKMAARRHGSASGGSRRFLCQRPRCLVCRGACAQVAFRECETDRCSGIYCRECYEDLQRICPLCLHGCCNDSNDDVIDALDDDLQSYTRFSRVFV